jgi:two-component system, chemotaxis family, response regulator Rcp1
MQGSPAKLSILVIESNLDHARLIKTALTQNAPQRQIILATDGTQAIDFLHQRGTDSEMSRPDLILLDLNLLGRDGREILIEIKTDPRFKRIPIVVLTTSNREEDVLKSYALQGNCYVIKSSDLDQLFQIVKRIEEFWLGIVTLPVE